MTAAGTVDPKRFEGEGLNFRAKLIGVDDVEEARGDKMCQLSMQKLKAAVKVAGEHKQRIVVNVSLEGLKIIDGVSMAIQYTHAVHRISFIARDTTDSRAFGYIFGVGDGTHKFFAIKTEKAAEQLVLTLRDLFQSVYEMKKQEVEEAKKKQEDTKQDGEEAEQPPTETAQDGQEPVYQVPSSDVPSVNDSPEHIYSVPQNNTPVAAETEKNLFDLEDQLENMELQMSSFDNMFDSNSADAAKTTTADPWGTGTTAQSTEAPQSSTSGLEDLAGLDDGFKAPSPFPSAGTGFGAPSSNPFGNSNQPLGGAGGQAFGQPATTMGQGFGQPITSMNQAFGQPGPAAGSQAFGQPATTAGSQMFGQPGAAVGSQPFGQQGAFGSQAPGSQAFGPGPGAMAPGVAFGMPGTPMPGTQPQVRPGFGQAAPGGFGQAAFGQPAQAAAFGQPAAAFPVGQPAAAAPQAGFNAFGAPAFPPAASQQAPQQNLFPQAEPDPNILAPLVLNEPKTEEVVEEPPKKDAFADLVNIGGTDPRKTPKAIFEEISTPPKRTLNELKVEGEAPRSPSPGMPSAGGVQQASDDPSWPDQLPGPTHSSEDPFDTSHMHIPHPTSQSSSTSSSSKAQDRDPFLPSSAQPDKLTCDNTESRPTPVADDSKHKQSPPKKPTNLTNGEIPGFSNTFNLPSPDEPPPPLPGEGTITLPVRAPPPPPPRPKHEINAAVARPRPVPKPRSVSSTDSPPTTRDPFSAPPLSAPPPIPSPTTSTHSDPFAPSSSTDPFSAHPHPKTAAPTGISIDPFSAPQSMGKSIDPFSAPLPTKTATPTGKSIDPFSAPLPTKTATPKGKSIDPFSAPLPTKTATPTGKSIDPFSAPPPTEKSIDPFSAPTKTAAPTVNSTDPFISSQPSQPTDKWDPFDDFDNDLFKNSCFTVFDSSPRGNGSMKESVQEPLYATVNKNPPPPSDGSLI